jgi:type I restriction enzyme S subunit
MTSEIQAVRLREVCWSISDGDWIETKDQSQVGFRLLQIGNIGIGRFRESGKPRFVSTETFKRLKCTQIEIGDVLIARMPDPTGRAWCVDEEIPPSITSVDVAIVRVEPSKLDPKYLAYFFNSPNTLAKIAGMQTGSTRQRIKRSDLEEILVPLPSLDKQKSIAELLGTIDRKIACNSAIAESLESLAQSIFKSWFIDFDPVKAKMAGEMPVGVDVATTRFFPDSMEASELGLIPKGWKVQSLSDIGEFRNGLAMQKFPVVDEDYVLPVIKIAQLRVGNTNGADMASGLIDPKFVISDGDILFSWSGTLEIEHWAGGQGALNQHLFKVLGKTVPDWFIYYSSRNHLPEFRRIASGKATTMGHIQRGHLAEAKVAVPPAELLTSIGELLRSLVSQKVALVVQNRALAELREALLPRLMSGELQIPEEMLAS